jgi:hypothetical protein
LIQIEDQRSVVASGDALVDRAFNASPDVDIRRD